MTKRNWFRLSAALNLLGLLLAAWAVHKLGGPRYLAHRLHTTDAWPTYTQRESQLALLPIDSGAVVFLGDSHVAYGEWHEWLPDYKVANRGIPGAAISHVAAYAKTLDLSQASAVVLQVGTNDLLFHEPDSVYRAYGALVSQLSGQLRHADRLIACTPPGVNNDVRWTGIDEVDARQVISDVAEAAFDTGAALVHTARALGTRDGILPARLTDDGVHLRGEGYRIWVREVEAALARGTTLAR